MTRRARYPAVLLWSLVFVLLNVFVVFGLISIDHLLAFGFAVGVLFGQTAVASVWLALGTAPAALRTGVWLAVIVGCGYAASWIALPLVLSFAPLFFVYGGFVGLLSTPLRGRNVRWRLGTGEKLQAPPIAGHQWSLKTLFAWTGVAAVFAFSWRYANFYVVADLLPSMGVLLVGSLLLAVGQVNLAARGYALVMIFALALFLSFMTMLFLGLFLFASRGGSQEVLVFFGSIYAAQTLYTAICLSVAPLEEVAFEQRIEADI